MAENDIITRGDMFLSKMGGGDTQMPTPITREEILLAKVAEEAGGGDEYQPKELETPLTIGGAITTTVEGALGALDSGLNAHTTDTSNPHAVTKAQVGLGNADNTSDTDKPISTAQQSALDAKQPKTLDMPLTVGGISQTTVEGALGSLNTEKMETAGTGLRKSGTTVGISDGGVGTEQLAAGSVTFPKINPNAVLTGFQAIPDDTHLVTEKLVADKLDEVRQGLSDFIGNFQTKAALAAYSGTITRNDYAVVQSDETHRGECWRYIYNGTLWEAQYKVNNTPFTQAQQNAIDSGVTSAKVIAYDGHISNTSNPHAVTKAQVGLGNVANTGDSATPVSGGTTKFTTGGAYTELGKKQDVITAGTGLSFGTGTDAAKLGHSNSITANTTKGIKSFSVDGQGHVTGYTAKSVGRGLSDSSNTIGHSNTAVTAKTTSKLREFTHDSYGHITNNGTEYSVVSTVDSSSTDTQIPTASAVYGVSQNIFKPNIFTFRPGNSFTILLNKKDYNKVSIYNGSNFYEFVAYVWSSSPRYAWIIGTGFPADITTSYVSSGYLTFTTSNTYSVCVYPESIVVE